MPSPFPGMDPYLEDPGLWRDVHASLINNSQSLLAAQLRPKYAVRVEDRTYVTNEADEAAAPQLRIPDVQVSARQSWNSGATSSAPGTQTLELAEPMIATTWFEQEMNEHYLKILDREKREVVAVIEFVSPTNKIRGSAGRDSFEQKRREIMNSSSHWIEIDLLRGTRMVVVPPTAPPHEYLVHVSPRNKRPTGYLYPISIKQRLPIIPIPLEPGDPAARLDLQAVLDASYDRAAYDLAIDYQSDPDPPLDEELAEWSKQILQSKSPR